MRTTIPDDLIHARREWSATYRQLAVRPGSTALRRRLLLLSTRLYFHPALRSPAARTELRRLAAGHE